MNPIKMTVITTGAGHCALSGRECDGITVAFEGEPQCFLFRKSLRQLISMKAGQPTKPSVAATPSAKS